MNEISIVLISHGYFAEHAMKSAEMIVGKQENYRIVSITEDKNLEDVLDELREVCKELKSDREIIILADIFGGTPCNAGSKMILDGHDVILYTGFSLPVLLELLLSRELPIEEIKEKLEAIYRESFIDINKKISATKEEEGMAL